MGMGLAYVKSLETAKRAKAVEQLAKSDFVGSAVYGFWSSPEARELRAQLNKAGI